MSCSCPCDPNDPPCGAEECGGPEATADWLDEESLRAEESGGDPDQIYYAYGMAP